MDVFALRDRLVADYEEFTRSFINVRDERIREVVEPRAGRGLALARVADPAESLVRAGRHDRRARRRGRPPRGQSRDLPAQQDRGRVRTGNGAPLRLHRHQEEAIRVAATGANYVLTTGTGSGKSLTYIVPIVDQVLREGPGKGIRAIVVYPMNALANSQAGELEKFLKYGFPDNAGPVTFARYTGQEKRTNGGDHRQARPTSCSPTT